MRARLVPRRPRSPLCGRGARARRLARACLVAAVCATPGLASPRDGSTADAPAGPRRFVLAGACRTVDPALIRSGDDERVVLACNEGLTTLDPATGEVKPGAAASWTTSPDGRVWTFALRDAVWQRRFGEGFEDRGPVTAHDFVAAWQRLFRPELRSPHRHLLDVLTGVRVLSTERPKVDGLDRVITDLLAAIGGEDKKRTLPPGAVAEFLNDRDRNARAWLAELDAKEAVEFLRWPAAQPYQGPRAMALVKVLRQVQGEAVKAVNEAEARVGVDRGFYAKDDKTLVVEVAGPSPWLPSLLARGPLVPVHRKNVERHRDFAFTKRQNQVNNGRYVVAADFPLRETDSGGERWAFKVELHKNPKHHDAARTASDQIVVLVDNGPDEVLRQYTIGQCQWILTQALSLDVARGIRSAGPGTKPDPKVPASIYFAAVAPDAYDALGGRVKVLRFRCAPPMDSVEARRAVAAVLDRDALAKRAPNVIPPPTASRLVHPWTTGLLPLPRTPSFDPSKAKGWYGKRRYPEGEWARLLCDAADDQVCDAIGKAWRTFGDDTQTTVYAPDDLRAARDAGLWDAVLESIHPDFDDPLAFLAGFTTKNPAMDTAWSHPVFDALVAGARDVASFAAKPPAAAAAIDGVKAALGRGDLEALRRTLLAEAEAILLEEAVVYPLWVPVDSGVVAKGVTGLQLGPTTKRRALLDVHLLPLASQAR